jgi:phage-related protein
MTSDATDDLKKRANELGLVLSDEAIDAGGKFADNMATLKLALAAVGTNIISRLMPAVSKFIEKILPLISRILPKLADAFGTVFEAIWPLIEMGLNAFAIAVEWIADNIDWLLPLVGALVVAFVAYNAIMSVINAINTIATASQLGLNAAMLANPVGIVVLAVLALIAAVALLVSNWDAVSKFFVGLWETISSAAATAWGAVVDVWNAVSAWFTDNIITPVGSAFSAFWLTVSNLFSTLWAWIKGIWEGAKKWFDDTVINPIATAFSTFWNGISTTAKKVWDDIVTWINDAITKIKEFLGLQDQGSATHVTTNGTTSGGSGKSFATGLRYVPYDNFAANLHMGESILTKADATEYRKGRASAGVSAASLSALRDAIVSSISGLEFVGEINGRELYRAVRKEALA